MNWKKGKAVLALAAFGWLTACNNEATVTETSDTTMHNEAMPHHDSTMQDHMSNAGAFGPHMHQMMQQMQAVNMTGDFDTDFANTMLVHHQGAIQMAEVELAQGKDEELKKKAQEIMAKQKEEMQQLKDFLAKHKPSDMKHGEGALQKHMADMQKNMSSMMNMTGDTDKDFARMMKQHHEQGIAMAKMELEHGMADKLKEMMRKSIDHQQKDIQEFESWLSKHS